MHHCCLERGSGTLGEPPIVEGRIPECEGGTNWIVLIVGRHFTGRLGLVRVHALEVVQSYTRLNCLGLGLNGTFDPFNSANAGRHRTSLSFIEFRDELNHV